MVYDEQQRKAVKVCRDDRRCYGKYVKRSVKVS